MTPSEREAREALESAAFYSHAIQRVCVPESAFDAFRRAILDAARARVEAERIGHQGLCSSQMPTAPNHPECDCFSADYNAAIDAALAALTDTEGTTNG